MGASDVKAEAAIRGSTYAGALVDEVTVIPEPVFRQLSYRLSVTGARCYVTTNPDSPYHWFKKDYLDQIDKEDMDLRHWQFNFDDNPTLDPTYIRRIKAESHGLWYKRFIEGLWVLAEGAIYDIFEDKQHVIPHQPNMAREYVVGVDYGTTNPCVFVLIGYNPETFPQLWIEKEYYYDSKKSNRQKTDSEYATDMARFIENLPVKAIYIDPSAASFKNEMRRAGIQNIFDADNDVMNGIRVVAELLYAGTFKVCQECKHTIAEFGNYIWDARAAINGVEKPLKQHDHCFGAMTPVATEQGDRAISSIKRGDRVWTRKGLRKVVEIWESEKDLYEWDLMGLKIECTEGHEFWTLERGKVPAGHLLQSDILCVNIEECVMKSNLTGLSTGVIQTPQIKRPEDITELLRQTAEKSMDICIEPCGSFTMEKSPMECISITSTATSPTMTLAISNVFLHPSIINAISFFLQKNKKKLEKSGWRKLILSPRNGTALPKVENGIGTTPKKRLEIKNQNNTAVSYVKQNLNHINKHESDFVRIIASQNGEEKLVLMMRKELVRDAVTNSLSTSTQKKCTVGSLVPRKLIGKRKVYNLTVEGEHEYFAHNLLVSNSLDAIRYALFTRYRRLGQSYLTAQDIDRMRSEALGLEPEMPPFFRGSGHFPDPGLGSGGFY